jgi:chitinase
MALCFAGSALLCAAGEPAQAAGPNHGKVAMAYVYDANAPVLRAADAAYLTHINWSFALIKNGRVTGDHWRHLDALLAYRRAHPHIRAMLSIGGWGAEGFSQAAATQAGIDAFVESAMALVTRHGFDGVDVDWEYPCDPSAGITAAPEDKKNFTKLLQALRAGLNALQAQDGRVRQLSIAVGASRACAQNIEGTAVAAVVDYVNLMSYDMHGARARTAHHANLLPPVGNPQGASAQGALAAFMDAGIPARKLVLGAAFYGHLWHGVSPGSAEDGLYQNAQDTGAATLSFAALQARYVDKNGFRRSWDASAAAPTLYDGSTFISYEDGQSIRAKGAYVRQHGLAGVMFWEYTQDESGALVRALHEGLTAGG